MEEKKVINIARDFGRFPAGRYETDGPYSGESFREKLLVPALRCGSEVITVEFDGARGLASSFLEEAFGGLVRLGFDADQLEHRLDLRSADLSIVNEVREYIIEAKARSTLKHV